MRKDESTVLFPNDTLPMESDKFVFNGASKIIKKEKKPAN